MEKVKQKKKDEVVQKKNNDIPERKRRGRKRNTEKELLKGEQKIDKFIIIGKKIITPKRKRKENENTDEEEKETGKEEKKKRMNDEYERKPNFSSINPWERNKGPVKTLIDKFGVVETEKEERKKEERHTRMTEKEKIITLGEKDKLCSLKKENGIFKEEIFQRQTLSPTLKNFKISGKIRTFEDNISSFSLNCARKHENMREKMNLKHPVYRDYVPTNEIMRLGNAPGNQWEDTSIINNRRDLDE